MIIRSNLAITIDGKIAREGGSYQPLGSHHDRDEMQRLRNLSDIVIIGASTLRQQKRPCLREVAGAEKYQSSPLKPFCNAVLSRSLEGVSATWPFFKVSNLRRLLFVTQKTVPASRRTQFFQNSEIIFLKKRSKKTAVEQMVDHLKISGFSSLLVEGGGELMWEFASRNLIDEYHITLTPKILGGRLSPTLIEGAGFSFSKILSLDLVQVRQINSELLLTYRKRL